MAVVLVGGVAWGVASVLSSPALTVRHVDVVGHERLSPEAVEALVPGLRRENILTLDLEAYRARLVESPWVAEASLSRLLPATVRIAIVERTPSALARRDSQLYLVDERGSIIGEFSPAFRDLDLPVIDGLVASAKGPAVADAARARLAASFLTALEARPDLRGRISQIDVSNAHDVTVMLDDDGAWIHVGEQAFAERLTRYIELRPTFVERFGVLDYADVRFERQIYVRSRHRDLGRRQGSD